MTEKASEVRYLLSDGLGSIRQATDDSGAVVAYGSPTDHSFENVFKFGTDVYFMLK
ncbi:MAG: hypothetical protein H6631_00975 [Anaerolineaceae bacterium]|nr:hypothetical protein [Anaerolineaceae bacterium]